MSKSLLAAVKGFMGHYGDEAALIADALRATLTALPIDAHDRATMIDTIERLENLPEKLAGLIGGITDAKVTVKKADVADAVASELPSALSAILPDAVASELPSALSAILPDMLEKLIAEKLDTLTAPAVGDEAGAA